MAVDVIRGQSSEINQAIPLLDSIRVMQHKGRPKSRPRALLADKAYDSKKMRRSLRERNITAVIPFKRLPEGKKTRKKGRPFSFDKVLYTLRNTVERTIAWIKEARRLAVRYEKLALHYKAMLYVAFIKRYLKAFSNTA